MRVAIILAALAASASAATLGRRQYPDCANPCLANASIGTCDPTIPAACVGIPHSSPQPPPASSAAAVLPTLLLLKPLLVNSAPLSVLPCPLPPQDLPPHPPHPHLLHLLLPRPHRHPLKPLVLPLARLPLLRPLLPALPALVPPPLPPSQAAPAVLLLSLLALFSASLPSQLSLSASKPPTFAAPFSSSKSHHQQLSRDILLITSNLYIFVRRDFVLMKK